MKSKVLGIILLALSLIAFDSVYAVEDSFGPAKELKTGHFTVFYPVDLDLNLLNQELNITLAERMLNAKTASPNELDSSLDILFEQVCAVLDMRLYSYQGVIKIAKDHETLKKIYRKIFDKDLRDMKSFYLYDLNTIYISASDFTKTILGHEIAHAVISHYFVVQPSTKIQEVLAGYVEYQLRKDSH